MLDIGSLDKDAPSVPRELKETEAFISPLEYGWVTTSGEKI